MQPISGEVDKVESAQITKAEDFFHTNEIEKLKPYIGERNQAYYLKAFGQIERKEKKYVWNWSSFIFSQYWMIYRGVFFYQRIDRYLLLLFFIILLVPLVAFSEFAVAFAVLLVSVFLLTPTGLLLIIITMPNLDGNEYPMIGMAGVGIGLFLVLLYSLGFGLLGNRMFYKYSVKQESRKIKLRNNRYWFRIVFCIFHVAFIGLLSVVQFDIGTKRFKRIQIAEATISIEGTKLRIEEFYDEYKRFPNEKDNVDYLISKSNYVEKVVVNNGTITINFNGDFPVSSSITYTPTIEDNRNIFWRCTSQGLKKEFLPSNCRKD